MKELANRKIVIRVKYPLTENLALDMARKTKTLMAFFDPVEKGVIMGMKLDIEPMLKCEFEDEEKERKIYTVYFLIPAHMMGPNPAFFAGGFKSGTIDEVLEAHAKAFKRDFRFVESSEVVKL